MSDIENQGHGLESTSNSTPASAKQEADDLASDMLKFCDKYLGIQPHQMQIDFLTEMCMYITERDAKTKLDGIKLGIDRMHAAAVRVLGKEIE